MAITSFEQIESEPFVPAQQARIWPALVNAALWGAGSGLIGAISIGYLLRSRVLDDGILVPLLVAAPSLVGLARMGAIRFTHSGPARKRFCIGAFLFSTLLLCALATLSLGDVSARWKPTAWPTLIVAVWSGAQLLESMGLVALWAWIDALVPRRRMGFFIGNRNACLEAFRAIGMIAGGVCVYQMDEAQRSRGFTYAILAFGGAGMLLAAAAVLLLLPARAPREAGEPDEPSASRGAPFWWREALTPFLDPEISKLLAYGCWFSFFNGFTLTAQESFTRNVVELGFFLILGMKSACTLGQAVVSPMLGKIADRIGNCRMMFASQLIVGVGMLGYLFASESRVWLIGLAWLFWVAYAGINIGAPNLLLKLAPPGQAGACVAGYFAVTGLAFGASTVVGWVAFEMFYLQTMRVQNWDLTSYQYLFYLGVVTRIMGAGLLLRISETRKA